MCYAKAVDLINLFIVFAKYRDARLGLINKGKWYNDLRRYIEINMQTDMIPWEKLSDNEITNAMEYITAPFESCTHSTTEYKR